MPNSLGYASGQRTVGMGRAADDVPDPAAEARWLLVAWRTDGSIRYALSNLPPTATLAEAVGFP